MTYENNKTTVKKKEQVVRQWFVLDASGKTLGRFASEVAKVLRGKHRPDYTPYVDTGDGVIIINAEKIQVTGSKRVQKIYRYYTGSMSGLREIPFDTMQARHPSYIIEHAVREAAKAPTLKAALDIGYLAFGECACTAAAATARTRSWRSCRMREVRLIRSRACIAPNSPRRGCNRPCRTPPPASCSITT